MSIATEPHNIDRRLTRFLTVVWLRLLRMLGKLLVGEAPYREDLNAMSRFVAAFMLIRACDRLEPRPASARPHTRPVNAPSGFRRRRPRKSQAFVRTAVGARLWRRLRGRTAFAPIAALIRAILNLGGLIDRLVERMKRRLTRLSPLVLAHAHAEPLARACAFSPNAHDTS
jgi:hypothetical protein